MCVKAFTIYFIQGATQSEMLVALASGRDYTTNPATVNQTTLLTNHMLPNCEWGARDPVVTRTYFSWTLSAQRSLITATSRIY